MTPIRATFLEYVSRKFKAMHRLIDYLMGIYANSHWISRASPAVSAAGIAGITAVLVVAANRRRTANQYWALSLVTVALWQASVAGVQLIGWPIFVRFAVLFAGCAAAAMALLKEVILEPKRPMRTHLRNIRLYWMLIPLYCLIFVAQVPSLKSYGSNAIYRVLSALCIGSGCFIVLDALNLIRKRRIGGFAARELRAFTGLAGACFVTAVVSIALGRITGVRYIRWFAPSILIVGLLFFISFVARNQFINAQDFKQKLLLWSARGIGCLFVGLFFASSGALFGVMSPRWALVYCLVLGTILIVLWSVDRQFRILLDKHFVSPGFHLSQLSVNAENEKNALLADLHAGYVEVLKRWSGGSRCVSV